MSGEIKICKYLNGPCNLQSTKTHAQMNEFEKKDEGGGGFAQILKGVNEMLSV